MEKNFTQKNHVSRTNLFRSLLVVAFLSIASAFFTLPTPTAHAATSPSSSISEALRKAGYVQLKPHSYAQLSATYKTASPIAPNCPSCVFAFSDNLFSVGNKSFVDTDLGAADPRSAVLQAVDRSFGTSNAYNWYWDSNYRAYVIQSKANGLYVSAELGYSGRYNGMLRARSSTPGPWESFVLDTGTCNPVFDNCSGTINSLANKLYVSAELSYSGVDYGMLRARASVADAWELFRV